MSEENNQVPEQTPAAVSARPTGKRQLTGVATDTVAKVATEDKEKSEHTIGTFFPEVASEMKKVIWPTAHQMVVYTSIVLVFLIILTGIVAGVDFLAGLGVEKVLTR